MYRWYQESGVCYVYLADVPSNAVDKPEFKTSRWFTRGWTLQELIAPSTVIFLDQNWKEMGTKSSLQLIISAITGMPANILLGGNFEGTSIAQRMSWASKRETTRVEDIAYCLMGIFSINMPLLYGEGERAFIRLQEEIMKVSDDHSLFAWRSSENHGGLLATSPAVFFSSGEIIPFNPSRTLSGSITVNNKGNHLKLDFPYRKVLEDVELAIIPCTERGKKVAIYLKAISETKEYFIRVQSDELLLLNRKDFGPSGYSKKSICVRQERLKGKNPSPLLRAAKDGNEAVVKLLLKNGAQLESTDKDGRTPLWWAAENGHGAVVKMLLENGAEKQCVLVQQLDRPELALPVGPDVATKASVGQSRQKRWWTRTGRGGCLER